MLRILVVEDDPHLRLVLARLLREAGYHVTEFATGADPLDALREAGADLVLTDVKLPEMNGIGIILQIQARAPGVPVVAMVGGNPWDLQMLREAQLGAAAVLQKPFGRGVLMATIAAALAGVRDRERPA